jgi:DNA-binding NarL/FixJ family response regulator
MRVLLVDVQAKVRSALRLMLEQVAGLEVLGEAVDAVGLMDWAKTACPDVVLLDWRLSDAKGETLTALRRLCPHAWVIALSGRPEARQAALEAGADAFVSKGDPPERLLEAIRSCMGGAG